MNEKNDFIVCMSKSFFNVVKFGKPKINKPLKNYKQKL